MSSEIPNGTSQEAILRRVGRVAKATAMRLTGDPHAADDAAQEAMISAWMSPPQQPDRLDPWTRTVARNLVVDAYRARRARPEVELTEVAGTRAVEPGFEESVVNGAVNREVVRTALGGVTREQRDLLVEVYWGEASYAEAGERRGVSEDTVGQRLHRAKARARAVVSARVMYLDQNGTSADASTLPSSRYDEAILARIPQHSRQLIVMVEAGLSFEAIAKHFRRDVASIRQQLSTALRQYNRHRESRIRKYER